MARRPHRHRHRHPQRQPNHAAQGVGQREEEAKNAEDAEARYYNSSLRVTLSTLCYVTGSYIGGFTLALISKHFGASQDTQLSFFKVGAGLGLGTTLAVVNKFTDLTPRNSIEIVEGVVFASILHRAFGEAGEAMQR